jgi:enamine deaminase RidA (YjgF/YER057c/UK114 family)
MIQRSTESLPASRIVSTSIRDQLFVSASVTREDADPVRAAEEMYNAIARRFSATSSRIVHERCFGSIEFQGHILQARARAFLKCKLEKDTPVTFVEGESCLGNKFAGVQIRALRPMPGTKVRTILDHGIPKGRAWNLNGSTFYVLQGVDGGKPNGPARVSRKSQSEAMFRQAERLLRSEGATYQDVVRTWIYISDILDWYNEFNAARNHCYSEYGFFDKNEHQTEEERIYLPASTGIEGRNPSGLPATMDVFAIRRSPGSAVQIRPLCGTKQRSPFRYGSAFSRAVVVEEPHSKLILVSGTASIDEQGKSVYVGDSDAQIRHTLNVVSALIAPEGAKLQDLCEATVFLKRKRDFCIYEKIAADAGIDSAPSIGVIADICRDELMFELDAAFLLTGDRRS